MRKGRSPPGQGERVCWGRVPDTRSRPSTMLDAWTTGHSPATGGGVEAASSQGLSPVLGDRGVSLGRAVERDHVVLQHWLRLHRQVDKRGVCGEKRCPCRLRCFVHHGLGEHEGKGQQFHHQQPLPRWSSENWGPQQGAPSVPGSARFRPSWQWGQDSCYGFKLLFSP